MITAIDFGCFKIRASYRAPAESSLLTLFSERAEYAVLPGDDPHREALHAREISYGECDGSLVVFGNQASQVRWLSRKPCAPLFTNGGVPTSDAPARQILHVLTQAMLPATADSGQPCCFTVPGGMQNKYSEEFLSRLIRMHGYTPKPVSAAECAVLSSGSETNFTGITIVLGAESTEISVFRFGVELASIQLAIGANGIDSEIAKQFKFQVWDETGDSYLDLEAVREWKHGERIHLRNGISEREKTLARLYGTLLDKTAGSVRQLLNSPSVESVLQGQRLSVVCAGGPTQIAGFSSSLTERFVDHGVASDILSVKTVEDPSRAVVRGLLIYGELEQRRFAGQRSAA